MMRARGLGLEMSGLRDILLKRCNQESVPKRLQKKVNLGHTINLIWLDMRKKALLARTQIRDLP